MTNKPNWCLYPNILKMIAEDRKKPKKLLTKAQVTAALTQPLDHFDNEPYREHTLAQLEDRQYAYCARFGIDDTDLTPYQPYDPSE